MKVGLPFTFEIEDILYQILTEPEDTFVAVPLRVASEFELSLEEEYVRWMPEDRERWEAFKREIEES